jgi:tetratricopeptide (TPR) repeat protein
VLLLIAAYILEKGREKGFIAKPSMIYSQIDMFASRDRDEALASFGGNAEKAIKSLEMSIRTLEGMGDMNELAENRNKLALIYEYAGRLDEAETEYKEAIRVNPDFAGAHNNLGILLKNLKRFEEAEKEYKEAIRVNPDFAEAHNNLGNLLKNLKRFEEAEKEYKEAIRINPELAEAHGNLGLLYSQTGKSKDAKEELEIAKRLFEAQGREEDVKKAEGLLNSIKKRK